MDDPKALESTGPGLRRARRRIVVNRASAVQGDADWLCWVVGITVAALLRVDFEAGTLEWWGQAAVVPLIFVLHLGAAIVFGLYDGRFRRGSFEEAVALAKTVALTTPALFLIVLVVSDPRMVPLSAVPGGAVIALVLMFATRWGTRLREERRNRPAGDDVARTLVVGAGEGGEQIVTALLRDPDGAHLPVALLDDDPGKARLRLRGVPVVGTTDQVVDAAAAYDASAVLIAIPSASRDVIARITEQANRAELVVKILPTVRDLLDGNVETGDIRNLEPADLLGRHEVATDLASIAGYINGRRVLVTGAGGSIGSELCRQLAGFEPAELIMLDRDESALHGVQLSITGRALLDTKDVVLCDIRDRDALGDVFRTRRPEVVFHAAALKHLPMLEQYPAEAWKTNVVGTEHVLELAVDVGVERFVNVSTDKAADPTSVLGMSKRVAERLTAAVARRATTGTYLSVRFGNVLGSRGSVLETFTRQVAAGGPVTVTDPEVTRFFMTIGEACQLVIQAGAIGSPGEVLVLDMGRPVRIADVARQLVAQAGRDIEIVFTGLRPGEKLHEVLLAPDEHGDRPKHPLITHVPVPPSGLDGIGAVDGDAAAALAAMRKLSQPSAVASR